MPTLGESWIIRFDFSSNQTLLTTVSVLLLCDPQPGAPSVLGKSSPGPDEESVLDQNSDEEEQHPFHGHGEEVASHQVPREWRHEAILPWQTQCRDPVRMEAPKIIALPQIQAQIHLSSWK